MFRASGSGSRERGNNALRALDKWLGIPLVALFGLMRTRRGLPQNVDSIGLFMFGAIGDSLIAGSVIADLKLRFPAASIVGFISEANRGIIQILDGLDESVVVPISRPHSAVRAIRRRPVDIVLDFSPWPRTGAILSALAKARYTVGLRREGQYRHYAYDAVGEHRKDRHEIENLRDVVRCLGIDPVGTPRLKAALFDQPLPAELSRPYVVFHPWAAGYRHELREWPDQHWVELAQALIRDGYQIALSGAPHDRSRSLALAQAVGGPAVVVLAGRTTLGAMAAVLAKAEAVVSVNTGIMHLAAVLDCPLVALHGPTNPLRWGPLGARSKVLGPGAEDGGAYLDLGFEYPPDAPEIMGCIAVTDVLACLRELLRGAAGGLSGGTSSLEAV